MNIESEVGSPSNRERMLLFVRYFCEPETCAALEFRSLVNEMGDRESAELALKELWHSGFIMPTGVEADPEDDGALFEVPTPRIEDPIKDSSQFVLTDLGYNAVESLYEPYSDYQSIAKKPDIYVPRNIIVATEFINIKLMKISKKILKECYHYHPVNSKN